MVKRYNPVRQHGGCIMVEYEDGEYVRHREHAALAERCERLEAALRDARDELAAYEQDLTGETYNNPKLNALLSESSGVKA